MARRTQKPKTPTQDMDARKAAVLDAVVTEHIETAHPVGSQSVMANAGIGVSSATIRSEMVALERAGYLVQPHTSSGRVPTEKGYRYFVDHLRRGAMAPPEVKELGSFINSVQGEVKALYEQVTTKLSDITNYPAVIMSPGHGNVTVRAIQLVQFSTRRVLVVATLSDMGVERRPLDVDFDVDDALLAEASSILTALLVGSSLTDRLELPSMKTRPADLVRQAAAALLQTEPTLEGDHVFVGGAAKVTESFDTLDVAHHVLDVLEKELVIVSLFKNLLEQGVSVAIGSEHGYAPLASCAVVVAPLTVNGQNAGAVGLLGPTRMKYPEAMAAAEAVSEQLTERLNGGGAHGVA